MNAKVLRWSGCIRECVSCVCNALLTSTHIRTHAHRDTLNTTITATRYNELQIQIHMAVFVFSSPSSSSNVTPLFATGFSLLHPLSHSPRYLSFSKCYARGP